MPRPTRFLLDVAPLGGRNVDKFVGTVLFLLTQPTSGYSVALFKNLVIGRSGDLVIGTANAKNVFSDHRITRS
jgi:hypothetical protein